MLEHVEYSCSRVQAMEKSLARGRQEKSVLMVSHSTIQSNFITATMSTLSIRPYVCLPVCVCVCVCVFSIQYLNDRTEKK